MAAQALGALARIGAFVGIGATAVSSAIYDGTLSISSVGGISFRGERSRWIDLLVFSLSRLLLLNLSVLLSFDARELTLNSFTTFTLLF